MVSVGVYRHTHTNHTTLPKEIKHCSKDMLLSLDSTPTHQWFCSKTAHKHHRLPLPYSL